MTKDNKNNNRTADTAEMKTNQYAYQYPTEKNDIVVVDDTGNTSTTTKIGDKDVDIDKLNVPKDTKSVLYRTDVDEYNTKYKTSDLQNHNTGSGLDITTYSAYSGFKEPNKDPEKVIVGVAGTDMSNPIDMIQNVNLFLNRSHYNNVSTEELQNTYDGKRNPYENGNPNILYEIEIRKKVEALKKYRENGVPISIVGDSKGAEDGAYLALSVVKSTVNVKPGTCPTYNDADYSAVSLYLTNPKGIRVNDEDYMILKKMAQAGKVTVEVVYPEVLSKFGIENVWREIPYSAKIYTVPNRLRASIDNHKIGSYEEQVYQGLEGKYKFQCDEEPTEIFDYRDVPMIGPDGVEVTMKSRVKVGYRYAVSRVTDKSGKTMSVNDYFFEEQTQQLKNLVNQMNTDIAKFVEFRDEPILEYFTNEVGQQKFKLKNMHEGLIQQGTPISTYIRDHLGMDMTDAELQSQYERILETHVDNEAYDYKSEVRKRVEKYIESYKENVFNEVRTLELKRNHIIQELIPSIAEAKSTFQKSQEQIKLIVEKREESERGGF